MNVSKFLLVLLSIVFVTISMHRPVRLTPVTKPAPAVPAPVSLAFEDAQNAIASGNLPELKRILKQNPHVITQTDKSSQYPYPLLTWAAGQDRINLDVIKLLIEAGSNIHDPSIINAITSTRDGNPRPGSLETIQLLLNHGFDINSRDSNNATLLIKAAKSGNLDAVKLLLKYDLSTSHASTLRREKDNTSYFSLLPPDLTQKIAQHGKIDANIKEIKGKTALDFAEQALQQTGLKSRWPNYQAIVNLLRPITKRQLLPVRKPAPARPKLT